MHNFYHSIYEIQVFLYTKRSNIMVFLFTTINCFFVKSLEIQYYKIINYYSITLMLKFKILLYTYLTIYY